MLHVYFYTINTHFDYWGAFAQLPFIIQNRIKKKKRPSKKLSSLAAYLLLQKVIKKQFAVSLEDIKYKDSGKPYFENKNIFFSLSHSQNKIVVAISDESRLGIDIEQERELDINNSLFAFFSEVETEAILQQSQPLQTLLCYWSKKEALVKAVGGRMFDMANHTDVRYNSCTWKGQTYFFTNIKAPFKGQISLVSSRLITAFCFYELKQLF